MSKREQKNDQNVGLRDLDINQLFGLLAMDCRRSVVQILGARQITFTTQEYLDTYIKEIHKGQSLLMDLKLARKHLLSIPENVAELNDGQWMPLPDY